MSVCFKCQKAIPEDSLFCCYCGTKQEVTCPACGAVLPFDSLFCNKCGKALQESAASEPETVVSVEAAPAPVSPEETVPAEPKKRGRKPVEKMPVGNPVPGFPNVSGFYTDAGANVSPSADSVVIGMGRWIARVDKNFNKTYFDTDDFGTYESFLASCQNADGIWVVTQEGRSFSHMPITLHYLDKNLKWDKSKDKKLADHGPWLSASNCVMRDKLFAFCSLEQLDEKKRVYKSLRITRYSIPSGREAVQEIPCSAMTDVNGTVTGLKKAERILTDGLNFYVKLNYDVLTEEGYSDTYTSWMKINLRSSKVENLECVSCFFDFDRGLMWRTIGEDEALETIAPERAQEIETLREWTKLSVVAASAIAKDAPILTTQVPVLMATEETETHRIYVPFYASGLTYFDGSTGFSMEKSSYSVYNLKESCEYRGRNRVSYERATLQVNHALIPQEWPDDVRCPHSDTHHTGNYPPVFWQGKVISCYQNTGILKLSVYPTHWEEDEPAEEMLKLI